MAKFETKFAHAREDWETPDSIFKPLEEEFGIVIDVCASEHNKKCSLRYTIEENGLLQDWSVWHACWMNPPFGEQAKWVKKAYEESLRGATVVCLLPARTNTNWWHDFCMKGTVRFLRGRPVFVGAKHGLPQPLAIVIFQPPNTACTGQAVRTAKEGEQSPKTDSVKLVGSPACQ